MGEEATVLPWPHRKKGHLISRSISVHYDGKKWPNLKAITVFQEEVTIDEPPSDNYRCIDSEEK